MYIFILLLRRAPVTIGIEPGGIRRSFIIKISHHEASRCIHASCTTAFWLSWVPLILLLVIIILPDICKGKTTVKRSPWSVSFLVVLVFCTAVFFMSLLSSLLICILHGMLSHTILYIDMTQLWLWFWRPGAIPLRFLPTSLLRRFWDWLCHHFWLCLLAQHCHSGKLWYSSRLFSHRH